MVDGRQDHTNLKANEQRSHDQLIDHARVHLQQHNVVVGQPDEQEPAENVTPDVDRFVRPPEDTLQAEFRGQDRPVAGSDERIKLQVLRGVIVAEQLTLLVVRDVLLATDQFRRARVPILTATATAIIVTKLAGMLLLLLPGTSVATVCGRYLTEDTRCCTGGTSDGTFLAVLECGQEVLLGYVLPASGKSLVARASRCCLV